MSAKKFKSGEEVEVLVHDFFLSRTKGLCRTPSHWTKAIYVQQPEPGLHEARWPGWVAFVSDNEIRQPGTS